MNLVPKGELESRMSAFRKKMDELNPGWNVVLIVNKVNLFYFTGTQQNGVLTVQKDGDAIFFVRRSYQRAELESNFEKIVKIKSFRDIAPVLGCFDRAVYMEKEFVPLAHFERINKYLRFEETISCDHAIAATRAVKTKYELDIMRSCGKLHRETLEDFVPTILREGMSEKELGTEIFKYMMDRGHHGVTRIGMFNTELFQGQICFGENSMYFNTFDGPGGIKGMNPAVPLFGNDERKLKRDELVFVDIGCGMEGYHTDKTQVYAFGELTDEAYKYHEACVEILNATVNLMRPGGIPSKIYDDVMSAYDEDFQEYFMGVREERVKFLGHGVGLVVDEYPVFARGFDLPLEEGMVMAVEPKRGVPGTGLMGIENTYMVTDKGGVSLTGDNTSIIKL